MTEIAQQDDTHTSKPPTIISKALGAVAWCVFVPVLALWSKIKGRGIE